jgi:hypothetical protein
MLPFGSKSEPLLGKHKSWISKKTRSIRECLKEASRKKVVERTEKEIRDLVHPLEKTSWSKICLCLGFRL